MGTAIDNPKYAILYAMNEAIDNEDNAMDNISATITLKKITPLSRMNGAQRSAYHKRRERKVVSTGRQKAAARIRSEQPLASDKSVLLQAGYDNSTATVPTLITNSVGYKYELAKYGLTEELITSSLVEDIQAKPQKRVRELELGADILSMRKRPVEPNQTLNIAIFSTEQQERIAQRIIETLGTNKQDTDSNTMA